MQMKTMCNLYNHSRVPLRKAPFHHPTSLLPGRLQLLPLLIIHSHLLGKLLSPLSEVGPAITV